MKKQLDEYAMAAERNVQNDVSKEQLLARIDELEQTIANERSTTNKAIEKSEMATLSLAPSGPAVLETAITMPDIMSPMTGVISPMSASLVASLDSADGDSIIRLDQLQQALVMERDEKLRLEQTVEELREQLQLQEYGKYEVFMFSLNSALVS